MVHEAVTGKLDALQPDGNMDVVKPIKEKANPVNSEYTR